MCVCVGGGGVGRLGIGTRYAMILHFSLSQRSYDSDMGVHDVQMCSDALQCTRSGVNWKAAVY